MANRIATQANVDIPWTKAPDTSRIMATKLTRPVSAPSAAATFLFRMAAPRSYEVNR